MKCVTDGFIEQKLMFAVDGQYWSSSHMSHYFKNL